MMPNNSPKNNNPKLKWWQKGALVGLILGVVEICFMMLFMMLSGRPIEIEQLALQLAFPWRPNGGLVPGVFYPLYFLIKISIFPFYFLFSFIFNLTISIWFPSPQPAVVFIVFLVIHFLSWIVGGIVWAFIFCILKKAADLSYRKDSQKNKRQ